jgi:hypothetical protein
MRRITQKTGTIQMRELENEGCESNLGSTRRQAEQTLQRTRNVGSLSLTFRSSPLNLAFGDLALTKGTTISKVNI